MVAVIIAFLSYVEVIPLWHVNFGIDNDFGNPLNTKITEPRVQTRRFVGLADKNAIIQIELKGR